MTEPTHPVVLPEDDLEILNFQKVFECPRFKVNDIQYKTKGEERQTFNVELTGDLLVIIPRFNQKILMINEFQAPEPDPVLTFPVGFLTPGVPLADTAQSILMDRTGCAAQKFTNLGTLHPSRYISNVAHVLAADGLYRLKDAPADVKEKVALYTEPEMGSLLMNRRIYDALALASYVFYATSTYFAEVHNGSANPNNA